MDKQDGLVQVSVSIPKSQFSLLPELMSVLTTAYNSTYSWDSMKLSVDSKLPLEENCRLMLNLGKNVSSDSETIIGKLHLCNDLVCKHSSPEEIVGDIKMTLFTNKTLKDHQKEECEVAVFSAEETEMEGSEWLEKKVSDEMFYPSWYDQLRMNGIARLDGLFSPESQSYFQEQINHPSPVYIVNNMNFNECYGADQFFSANTNTGKFIQQEDITDESFCLKMSCDKTISARPRSRKSSIPIPDIKKKIRQLKDRLSPDLPAENDFDIFSKDIEKFNNTCQVDPALHQYLFCNKDLPDISSNQIELGSDPTNVSEECKETESMTINDCFRKNILGSYSWDRKDKRDDEGNLLIVLDSNKKKKSLKSYSADAVSQDFIDGNKNRKETTHRKSKQEKRPKSGPDKKPNLIKSDAKPISTSQRITSLESDAIDTERVTMKPETLEGQGEYLRGKIDKQQKKHHVKSKKRDVTDFGDLTQHFDKYCESGVLDKIHRLHKEEANKFSDLEYIAAIEVTEDPDIKGRSKFHEEAGMKLETKHKKKKIIEVRSVESRHKHRHKHKEDRKSNKLHNDENENASFDLCTQEQKNEIFNLKEENISQNIVGSQVSKSRKKISFGHKCLPNTAKEISTDDKEYQRVVEHSPVNKATLSFLELISVMTDEVKQFARKREKKKIPKKIK